MSRWPGCVPTPTSRWRSARPGSRRRISTSPQFSLKMQGSPEAQAAYTQELFEIARRDRYAFVVWFLAIDYDKLYAKLPAGSEAMKLWRNIGFLDGELRPKPAWEIWKAGVEASRKELPKEAR